MTSKPRSRLSSSVAPLAAALVLLAGCGDSGQTELRQWMAEVQRQTPVTSEKIAEPKIFIPFQYARKDEVDPYSPAKFHVDQKGGLRAANSIQPDLNRRKETLEAFPLDTVSMVGTLQKPGLTFALLRVDRNVYQVRVGNYVGQNYGKVVRVTEESVELREIVRDAAGAWTERTTKLELQENEK